VLLAQALRPDAIILDVVLPDRSGWDVLEALKADPDLVDVPVIILTIVDERGRGLAMGATEYLVKPVDSEQLIELIHTCIQQAAGAAEPAAAAYARAGLGNNIPIDTSDDALE
jgi:DNA-binding response OmpR family regulator